MYELIMEKPGHVFDVTNKFAQKDFLEGRLREHAGPRGAECMVGVTKGNIERWLGKCPTAYKTNSALLQSSKQSKHGHSKTDSSACRLVGCCSSAVSRRR
jgi:hypothetical protein